MGWPPPWPPHGLLHRGMGMLLLLAVLSRVSEGSVVAHPAAAHSLGPLKALKASLPLASKASLAQHSAQSLPARGGAAFSEAVSGPGLQTLPQRTLEQQQQHHQQQYEYVASEAKRFFNQEASVLETSFLEADAHKEAVTAVTAVKAAKAAGKATAITDAIAFATVEPTESLEDLTGGFELQSGHAVVNPLVDMAQAMKANEEVAVVPDNYNPSFRPKQETPLSVFVDIVVTRLYDLREEDRVASVDVVVKLIWEDARLIRPEDPEPWRYRHVDPEELWNPNLSFYNQRPKDEPEVVKMSMAVNSRGVVRFNQRLSLELVQKYDFHMYPFDMQKIVLMAQSFSYDASAVKLIMHQDVLEARRRALGSKVTGMWTPSNWHGETREVETEVFPNVNMLIYTFEMQRKTHKCLSQEIFPMMLITMFTLSAPFVSPVNFDMRITIASIGLLTIMGFMYIVQAKLPPVGYFTWMMLFALHSFFSTFIVTVHCVLIHFLDPEAWSVKGAVSQEYREVDEHSHHMLKTVDVEAQKEEAEPSTSSGDPARVSRRRRSIFEAEGQKQCGFLGIRHLYLGEFHYMEMDRTSVVTRLRELRRHDTRFYIFFPLVYLTITVCLFVFKYPIVTLINNLDG